MLSFFPRDVLDEIWDLIESVSEEFSTYFNIYLTSSYMYGINFVRHDFLGLYLPLFLSICMPQLSTKGHLCH